MSPIDLVRSVVPLWARLLLFAVLVATVYGAGYLNGRTDESDKRDLAQAELDRDRADRLFKLNQKAARLGVELSEARTARDADAQAFADKLTEVRRDKTPLIRCPQRPTAEHAPLVPGGAVDVGDAVLLPRFRLLWNDALAIGTGHRAAGSGGAVGSPGGAAAPVVPIQ